MKQTRSIFFIKFVFLMVIFSFLTTGHSSLWATKRGTPVLARVEVMEMLEDLGLPVYAHLQDAGGKDYALVIAPQIQLNEAGVCYRILDKNARGADYFIITMFPTNKPVQADQLDNVLHDDGQKVIIRSTFQKIEPLIKSGFDVQWLGNTPMVLGTAPQQSEAVLLAVDYNAAIAQMINQVTSNTVETYTKNLSGENPVNVGGSDYTITTRYTDSGIPIEKATQYLYEFMQDVGLTVSYHNWSSTYYSGRNVIGELTGSTLPEEIVLITAHLDCMPTGLTAPGADDNASGSVGVMMSAELLSQYQFKRTVRFVFFTGEEQWLLGSSAYADMVYQNGENIVAVYNMDMIGYDAVGEPYLRLHTRTTSSSGYTGDLAIANTFVDVVNVYSLSDDLSPIIDPDGITQSDHSSFWNKGYSAILGIEDTDDDITPYYHMTTDTVSTLNLTYFTNFVKAAVGTAGHLAQIDDGVLIADFTASPTSGEAPLTVNFTDLSTNDPDTWDWIFEGGTPGTSAQQHPTITYNTAGTYTVTLTASNASESDSETKVDYITVLIEDVCTGTITNPGFETGTLSGWTQVGDVSITSESYTGSYGVSTNGTNSSVEQVVVDLCENTAYTISCWGKAKSQAGVYLGVKNYGGTEQTVQFKDNRNFVMKSITFTTGASNTSATIFFIKTGSKFDGIGDDFEIVKN